MSQEKFNPYINPDFLRSLEQERLRHAQRAQTEQRRSFVEDKLAEAREVADKLGTPIKYKLLDRRNVIVILNNQGQIPLVSPTQNQEPTEQEQLLP